MDSNFILNSLFGMMLNKVVIPTEFHEQSGCIKEMLRNDVTGLIDSLTDFAVNSATVEFSIETDNSKFTEILKTWLRIVNSEYRGKIPSGIDNIAKEYFKERWKGSSFPVLKIAKWDNVDGMILPTKMYFLDGGSIYAKEKTDSKDNKLRLFNYDYYIGSNIEEPFKLDKNIIFSKAYGRIYDKYPIPFLIKRGIYHNWKIISSLKDKQTEILNQVIPYMLLIKKGDASLVREGIKSGYSDAELKTVLDDIKGLVEKIQTKTNVNDIPARATNFDEELKHFIPDLGAIFKTELFAQAEQNILAGLGFIDIAEAVSNSRRESILNPKAFIDEINMGVKDFKQILKDLIFLIIEKNKEDHPVYINKEFFVTSSPVKSFMTDELKGHLRNLWKNGQISNKTYSELVGEVDYATEKNRREKEISDGTEILMYPHITENKEDKVSFYEEERIKKHYKEDPKDEDEDKNGNILPDDKVDPQLKEDYDMSSELEGSPYKDIKDLPARVKNNMTIDLQRVYMRVFNNAYNTYEDDNRAMRIAWGVIRKLARKDKKNKWIRRKKRENGKLINKKLSQAMVEEVIEKEEKDAIEDAINSKQLELMENKNKLINKLLENKDKE